VKVAFDTSVLVAALLQGHSQHTLAFRWVQSAMRGPHEGLLATHALAESWAVLTRHPTLQISPANALVMVRSLTQGLRCCIADAEVYDLALARCADGALAGGVVYDALHLQTARAQRAEVLVTFNTKHFARLWTDGDPRIVSPEEAP
jgi:predicted nucleic acid-binding protein